MPDDSTSWTVTDDWPEDVPVTEAEIEVFEAWFGDLFDAPSSSGSTTRSRTEWPMSLTRC